LRLVLRGARRACRAAYDDAYEEVDVTDAAARFGTLEAARLIFEASARAQQPVLTSVRSRELLSAAAQLSSAEADILFLKARQAGGQGGLFYSDFVQLCVDVCVRTAGGRVGGAARRLEQPAPRADADGDEESEEQPGLDEQLRALLSRMGTDANAAVPVAA